MKLTVESRTITGKKVSELRKEGKIPAVVYGKHLESTQNLVLKKIDFMRVYEKTGSSIPIELTWDGHDHLVLVADYQLDPVTDRLIHVDFHAVNKDEKVHADVPLVLTGVSPFEKASLWRVQILKDTISVEALPLDLPHDFKFDISSLDEAGIVVFVKDLALWENVEILDDLELAIISTVEFKVAKEDEETVETDEELTGVESEPTAE